MSSPQTPHHLGEVSPFREVWSLAWPTVLTMTSYTVMQFADKLMVGQVSPLQLTAQSNGHIWSFTMIGTGLGVVTVVNTYVSQNLGAGRPERGARYAWAAFWLSLLLWVCVLLPFAALIPLAFGLMDSHSAELKRLESGYAQILLTGSILMLCSRGMHHFFFGLHRPRIITLAALIGNVTNVGANYVLIFGEEGIPHLGWPGVPGVPAMGVYGAAIGTVIGTGVELVIPAAIFLGPKMAAELGTRRTWRPELKAMRDLLRLGWPAAVQWGSEILCWAIFMSVLVGSFGEQHMAAGWIALGYMHLSFMPALGASVAVTSLVGRYIGAGQPDTAVHRARLGLRVTMVYMTACAAVFLLLRRPLVALFIPGDLDPVAAEEIIRIGAQLMICAAVFQTADACGIIYTGALRGAGDTIWPGIVTIIYSWGLIVAGGWMVTVLWPGLESLGPWIAAAVYIILFGVTMAWRFEKGRWRSISLIEPIPAVGAAVAVQPPVGAEEMVPAE